MTLKPLPQQDIMTAYMLENPVAGIFADPGLGKTRATLDAIKALKAEGLVRGVLIVSPVRVTTLTWPDEVAKWGGLTAVNLRTPQGVQAWNDASADIYLINYEMLPKFVATCMKGRKRLPADMVVWDELSKARNPSSTRIRAFLPYRKKFTRHVGLTGTPAPNSDLDLFAPVRLLDGGLRLGPSYFAFRQRYAESDYQGYKWTLRPGASDQIRERIRDMTLVLRAEDWLNIPPVTVEDIDVALPDLVMKQYKQMQKEMLVEINSKEVTALTAAALVQKLAQFASGAVYSTDEDTDTRTVVPVHDVKVKALKELHQSIGRKPMLVYTQFTHETDRIVAEIPGAQKFDEKKVPDWNAGKIPMWVSNPKECGIGLSLQGTCHHVCWFTLGYSNEDYIQSNARIARTGQKNPTTIYRLLATRTVDWAMAEVLRSKEENQASLKDMLRHINVLASAK